MSARARKIKWATQELWPINAPSASWPTFDASYSSILMYPRNMQTPVPKFTCGADAIKVAEAAAAQQEEWEVYASMSIGTDTVIGAEQDRESIKRWRLDIANELDDGSLRAWPAGVMFEYRDCRPMPSRIIEARRALELKAEWAVDELYRLGVAAQVDKPHTWSQHSAYAMFEPDKASLDSVVDSFRDKVAETVLEVERYGGNCEKSLQRAEELVYRLSVQVAGAAFNVSPSLKHDRHLNVPITENARRQRYARDRVNTSEWATWGLWIDGGFRPKGKTTRLLIGDVPAELRQRIGGFASRGGNFGRRFRVQDPPGERPEKRARNGQSDGASASSSEEPHAA